MCPKKIVHRGTSYYEITSPNAYANDINVTINGITKTYPAGTKRVWLDRNLGASMVCTKSRDAKDDNNNSIFADDAAYATDQNNCFGDYYQWGRDTDGHQESNSTTTAILATDINLTTQQNIVDNNGSFITNTSSPYDWLDVDNNDVDDNGSVRSANWSKVDGTSICPVGYRVPTIDEISADTKDLTGDAKVENRDDAFNSFLKFPSAGYRFHKTGELRQVSISLIWSTSIDHAYDSNKPYRFGYTNSYASKATIGRAIGFSVRCIKD